MDRFADAHRRLVAVSLLVALLAVFWTGAAAHAETPDQPGQLGQPGVAVLAVAAPPAQGLANPPGAPDLPLADAEPPAPRDEVPAAATDHTSSAQHAPPRAHRQPAAGRAPPA